MMFRMLVAALAATAILSAGDGLLRVGRVPDANIVKKVQPAYPPDAQDANIQGVVRIGVVIGKDGKVQEARLLSGHPLLAPAALQAARKWVFKPFEHDGQPVRATAQIEIPFSLAPAQ